MNFSSSRYFYLIELEEGSLGGPFCRILVKHVPDYYFEPKRNFDSFINEHFIRSPNHIFL
ncbi:hypothetical protein BpHYR1_045969 [Brachionus plicatilis]|uniref:Uncharacterized protein n=1 Tax=Brachionus plicatilis TaxID=10195 RepID=A0A3M7T6P4_BRAPC|nr:hypothetical protein BpHYR1_045969 [Brachionus plicatilis]